jgi:hypothetical protein
VSRARQYNDNAERQRAYRDRKRNAASNRNALVAWVERLAPRMRAVDPDWTLRISDDGMLELLGNGPPAVWRQPEYCEEWLAAQERPRRRF